MRSNKELIKMFHLWNKKKKKVVAITDVESLANVIAEKSGWEVKEKYIEQCETCQATSEES